MCSPWLLQDNPSKEIKKTTLNFLVRNFGDLRTQSVRERYWGDINVDTKALIKRWQAGQTLEYFFKLISESALDTHWDYREKFWSSYYEDNLIEDAYVILGKEALADINLVKPEDRPSNFGKFAPGTGASPSHSVLILQISNLTIVEWSHSGAMRIYLSDNEKCIVAP